SSTLGRKVRITGDDELVEGDAVDLADDGALLVRPARGALVRVLAGDVEHCQTL
ncbi:MAG TPA: biotin--[acetyl-CoA-carboxylase] ligase, partial [Myxococcales bacterium]|nr:biotin--[acetyl-CoA-carboxylase] ligase [Myxococcales bacterium]